MTDGQWMWMLVHMDIDREKQLEKMCNQCKMELEKNKCMQCGKEIMDMEINESFNEQVFEELKRKSI